MLRTLLITVPKTDENLALESVIGAINIKRWNQLKAAFYCETNETFATKLLDLAQEYLNRNPCKNQEDKNKFYDNTNNESTSSKRKKNEIKRDKKQKLEKPTETIIHEPQNSTPIKIENLESSSFHQDFDAITSKNVSKVGKIKKQTIISEVPSTFNNNSRKQVANIKTKTIEEEKNRLTSKVPQFSSQRVCKNCNSHHAQNCCPLTYFPSLIVTDAIDLNSWQAKYKNLCTEGEEDNDDDIKYTFAKMSLPNLLSLVPTFTDHGLGVVAKVDVQEFFLFGPLIGKIIKEVDIPEDSSMRDIWEIRGESQNVYLNTEDLKASNWMRFVRPAPVSDDRNVTLITKGNCIYFVTTKTIKAGDELLYWYDSNVMTVNQTEKVEQTYCGRCSRDFAHPVYFRTHCSVFHDIRLLNVRKYHCKVCGAAFLGEQNITKHATEMHNGEGAFQCKFCKKYYLRLSSLAKHRHGCPSNPDRSWLICNFCGRKYTQSHKLKAHIKRMHSDSVEVTEFQCIHCLNNLGSKDNLLRHLKEVHRKPVDADCLCSQCGKHFHNKCNLKIHMLTHSGIKPFVCEVESCDGAFTTKQWLQNHYKKVHKFTEKQMPAIKRKVEFSFEAYSGMEEEEKNREMELNNDSNQLDSIQLKLEEDSEEDDRISISSITLYDPFMTDCETTLPPPEDNNSLESEDKNKEIEQNSYSRQFDFIAVNKLEEDISEGDETIHNVL